MKMLFLMTHWLTSPWSVPPWEAKHSLWWGTGGWRRERRGGGDHESSPPKGWELLVYKIHPSFTRHWKSVFGLAQTEHYANTSCFLRVFNTNLFSSWMKRVLIFSFDASEENPEVTIKDNSSIHKFLLKPIWWKEIGSLTTCWQLF